MVMMEKTERRKKYYKGIKFFLLLSNKLFPGTKMNKTDENF